MPFAIAQGDIRTWCNCTDGKGAPPGTSKTVTATCYAATHLPSFAGDKATGVTPASGCDASTPVYLDTTLTLEKRVVSKVSNINALWNPQIKDNQLTMVFACDNANACGPQPKIPVWVVTPSS